MYLSEQQVPHGDYVATVSIISHGRLCLYPLPSLVPTPARGGGVTKQLNPGSSLVGCYVTCIGDKCFSLQRSYNVQV